MIEGLRVEWHKLKLTWKSEFSVKSHKSGIYRELGMITTYWSRRESERSGTCKVEREKTRGWKLLVGVCLHTICGILTIQDSASRIHKTKADKNIHSIYMSVIFFLYRTILFLSNKHKNRPITVYKHSQCR
jgi:hypothetical protein